MTKINPTLPLIGRRATRLDATGAKADQFTKALSEFESVADWELLDTLPAKADIVAIGGERLPDRIGRDRITQLLEFGPEPDRPPVFPLRQILEPSSNVAEIDAEHLVLAEISRDSAL